MPTFSWEKFHTTSVTDRPVNWGSVYDCVPADLDLIGRGGVCPAVYVAIHERHGF